MSGELALVLHTHMPYVEGFGTWPFGEEWLFEAMATSYLPVLDVLRQGAPITLSLTPVLCDQLQAPGVTSSPPASPISPARGARRATWRALFPVRMPYPTVQACPSGTEAASIASHSARSAFVR